MGTGFVVPEARAICRSKSIHKVINTKLGEELLILSFKVKPSSFGLGVEVGVGCLSLVQGSVSLSGLSEPIVRGHLHHTVNLWPRLHAKAEPWEGNVHRC